MVSKAFAWKAVTDSALTAAIERPFQKGMTTEKKDISEQMNNHFCSLGSKLASGIPDTAFQPENF